MISERIARKQMFQCLQAYLVPIESNGKHKWSVLDLRLQAYLAPLIKIITTISGPALYF